MAELRDGDYFGAALHRAARIMSAAHGEQVLLSAATAQLVCEQLPESVTLREMGEHRLKGLLAPERLLRVVASDLRADFPPLASITGGHSLPAERDAFVGRREPLADLARRFDGGARLVSLLGLGGTGKTRLAIRFGWSALGGFRGGVWFCDLSQARDVDGIVHAVAQGLDVPLGKDDPVTQLGHAIAGRGHCLVILDNFEQVARYAEDTLGRWLDRASTARFLVTTREVLCLPGEEVVALAPLLPSDAVALFMRRAEAAKPSFQPSADDQAAIGQLVKLLDGLPLAIELAAARVRVMPPRTLLARMSERFKLLASTGGRVDRQATLRAVFDWSWDLLSLPEKAALAQLSVFEGGFTLESVEGVLDLSTYDNAPWPMDVLQSLVQKSIVRQATDDRFDLLVSTQEYAAEHLRSPERYAGSGPAALLAAEERHGAYFAGFDETTAVADGCADLRNFVVACRRAAARSNAEVAADTLRGAWAGLSLRGPLSLGAELASVVQAIPGLGAAAARSGALDCGQRAWRMRQGCRCADPIRAVAGAGTRGRGPALRVPSARFPRVTRKPRGPHGRGARASRSGAGHRTRHREPDVAKRRLQWTRHRGGHARSQQRGPGAIGEGGSRGARGRRSRARGPHPRQPGHSPCQYRKHGRGTVARRSRACGGTRDRNPAAGRQHNVQPRSVASRSAQVRRGARTTRGGAGHRPRPGERPPRVHRAVQSGTRLRRPRPFRRGPRSLRGRPGGCPRLGDRRSEGQFLSYLGLLHARQGNFLDARNCLDSGEALLDAVSDRVSLGILLCSRVETEHLAGVPDAARSALTAADAIAAEVGAGPESELGLALARVRDLIG
jgi:predicted ATPase